MTLKEKFTSLKRYFMAVLISIPILFVVDFLIATKIPNIWLIVIDCFIILLVYALWLVITQAYRNHITKKRTEFLHKKELKEKQEQKRKKKRRRRKKANKNYSKAKTKLHKFPIKKAQEEKEIIHKRSTSWQTYKKK